MFEMIDFFLGESLIRTKHSIHKGYDTNATEDKIRSPGKRQKITRLIGIPVQAGIFEDSTSEVRARLVLKYEQRWGKNVTHLRVTKGTIFRPSELQAVLLWPWGQVMILKWIYLSIFPKWLSHEPQRLWLLWN